MKQEADTVAIPPRTGQTPVGGTSAVVWAVASGIVLGTSLALGVRGDHSAYFEQWAAALTGYRDTSDAYGPLHALFAPLFALAPLLPKALFAGLALLVSRMLVVRGVEAGVARTFALVAVVFLFNPTVVVSTYVYGQNDIVAAAWVALALVSRADGRLVLAGAFIGMAALEKFFPLALAGFLALDGGRVFRLRILVSAVGTFLVGMLAAIWAWGPGVLTPVLFAGVRPPKQLSVLRSLAEHPRVVGGEANLQILVDANVWFVFGATGLAFLVLLWRGTTWRAATAIGCLVLLASYKVGHPQFYVTWLVLLAWLFVDGEAREERPAGLRLAPVAIFVGAFQVLYILGLVGMESIVRRYAGLPFLGVVVGSLVAAVSTLPRTIGVRPRVTW